MDILLVFYRHCLATGCLGFSRELYGERENLGMNKDLIYLYAICDYLDAHSS